MDWKNQLTKTPYLVLFVVLITIGVGTASAVLTITLSGNVIITDNLDVEGDFAADGTGVFGGDVEFNNNLHSKDKFQLSASSVDKTINRIGNGVPVNLGGLDSQGDLFIADDLEVGDTLEVEGMANVDGLSVGTDVSNDDDFILFDGGNEHIMWDESETLFRFSDHIATGAHAQFGSVNPDNVNRFGDGTPQSPEDMTGFGDLYLSDDLEVTDNLYIGGDVNCDGCVGYSDLQDPPVRIPFQVPRSNILSVVDSAGNVGVKNSITIGADGLPVISYRDQSNTNLKVAKCNNPSCTSATVSTVDSAGSVGHASSIAIGFDGFPVISYRDSSNQNLKVAKCHNHSCSEATPNTIDSAGNVGGSTNIAIGIDGLPVISYIDQGNANLKFARCNNPLCSAATPVLLDESGDVGKDSSMAIGADGLPVISYKDLTLGDLKVLHCGNTSCSSGNTKEVVGSVGSLGWDTSITIGPDGLPVISYVDGTNQNLKVAKCDNVSCSIGGSPNTIFSAAGSGFDSSITIGIDGLPVISFYDPINDNLKVARCNNPNCQTASITTVKSAGDVGSDSSITIGFDGLPVISYYDASSDELEVAKCGSTLCLSNWTRR